MGTGKPFIPGKAVEIAHYEITDAIITEDHTFKDIDDGLLFRQAYKYDIESAAVAYMLIKVGAKYPHILFRGEADGDTTIEFFHTPTTSADGDEEPSGNFNFNSANTSVMTWFPTPTVTDDGSYIANTWVLGGSGVATPPGTQAAGVMPDLDVVLIPTVEFLLKFTNTAGRDLQFVFEAIYKERTTG